MTPAPAEREIARSAPRGGTLTLGDLAAFTAEAGAVGVPASMAVRAQTDLRGRLRKVTVRAALRATESHGSTVPTQSPTAP